MPMPLQGEYEPSPAQWVSDQVEATRPPAAGAGTRSATPDWPIIIVTTRGNKSGKIRKFGLMRVEHGGEYALVASKGGAPEHPVWYYNLVADPDAVTIQDGPEPFDVVVRQVSGHEKARLVGAGRGGLPAVCGIPDQDHPRDPRLHRHAQERLTGAPDIPAASLLAGGG